MPSPGLTPYIYILVSCGWFAAMGLLSHEASREGCPWLVVAFARSSLVAIIAICAAWWFGVPLVFRRPRMLWIRSLAGSCSLLATFYALGNMLVSDVLTITNTFPIWVALLAWPLAGEKPSQSVGIAVLASVVGVGVALQPGQAGFRWAPTLAALTAALFTAVAMLGLHRLKGVSPMAVVVHFSCVSTVTCWLALMGQWIFAPDALPMYVRPSREVLWILPAVGITAAFGQVFLTRAYAAGSPTKLSVVALSQVLMVLAAEALFNRKSLDWHVILGTAMVLGPVAWLLAHERHPPRARDEVAVEEMVIE